MISFYLINSQSIMISIIIGLLLSKYVRKNRVDPFQLTSLFLLIHFLNEPLPFVLILNYNSVALVCNLYVSTG